MYTSLRHEIWSCPLWLSSQLNNDYELETYGNRTIRLSTCQIVHWIVYPFGNSIALTGNMRSGRTIECKAFLGAAFSPQCNAFLLSVTLFWVQRFSPQCNAFLGAVKIAIIAERCCSVFLLSVTLFFSV